MTGLPLLPTLRPLSMGQLLDQAIRLYCRHFWPSRSFNRFCVVLFLAILTVAAVALSAHADGPVPLDEYWREIESARASVARLEGLSPEAQRAQLQSLADRLERITAVALPDGNVVPVNHGVLVATLRADPPDLERLANLLDAMLDARDGWPQHRPPDSETLARILARPEFQWPEEQPSPLAGWWRRLWERFWTLVRGLSAGEGWGATILQFLLPGLAALALLAALAYALRGVLAGFVSESEMDAVAEGGESLTAAAALKRAQALSGAGDYRTAVRYLYLSSLLLLEERGLLRYDRSLTNREYLRSVAHMPQLAAVFRDVVEVFDRVWYGFQPLDQAQYDRYAGRVDDLRHQK